MTMLFEVDIELICVMAICLGGCIIIGHITVHAGGGHLTVIVSSVALIAAITVISLNIAGRRIVPRPRPTYVDKKK